VLRKTREHITLTKAFHEESLEYLKKYDPKMYEETRKIPFTEQHYVQETVYENVVFDEDIPESAFHPDFEGKQTSGAK
jgi:hypothetical protein